MMIFFNFLNCDGPCLFEECLPISIAYVFQVEVLSLESQKFLRAKV